jgi:hypothetical protein
MHVIGQMQQISRERSPLTIQELYWLYSFECTGCQLHYASTDIVLVLNIRFLKITQN